MKRIALGTAFLFGLLGFIMSASAEDASQEKIFLLARPSTLRIVMIVEGDMRYAVPGDAITDENGEMAFEPTAQYEDGHLTAVWTGTGFLVNGNGYLLTNAHVADNSATAVKEALWNTLVNNLYDALVEEMPDSSQSTLNATHEALVKYIALYSKLDESSLTYDLSVLDPGKTEGTIDDLSRTGFIVDVKKIGQPFPEIGKDIALVKIEKAGLTTLRLGDSDTVKQGDRVFVLGYPGAADLNEQGLTEPTLTSGIVSALKKSSQGDYNVIQIDAAISGGNSGGPVFNQAGQVIGIATFASTENEGYNWILPINITRDYLSESGVKNEQTKIDGIYQEAVDAYFAKYFSKAKTQFEIVNSLYPNAVFSQLINQSNRAIANGEEKKAFPLQLILTGVAALIIVVALVSVIMYIRRRKIASVSAPVEPPPDTALIEYIEASKKQNIPNEEIYKQLKEKGWPDKKIVDALEKGL